MKVQDNAKELRNLLEIAKVPEKLILEFESKPQYYRDVFEKAIRAIWQNEVLNLLAFMEMRENIQEKFSKN